MAADHDQGDFWPAYVASVAGLVQALLLVASVLAMAAFEIGQAVAELFDAGSARDLLTEGPAAPSASASPPPQILETHAAATSRVGGANSRTQQAPRDQVAILFRGDDLAIGPAAGSGLRSYLASRQQDTRAWSLKVSANSDDPVAMRAAYLRLLAVRNILLEAGVVAGSIGLRIVPVTDVAATDHAQTIFLQAASPGPASVIGEGRARP